MVGNKKFHFGEIGRTLFSAAILIKTVFCCEFLKFGKMSGKCDQATGVKPFSIGGRMIHVRERCLGMTDEERRWRAQFLKDQILSPEEPREVPELYKDTTNVFRRLWKTPMWKFQKFLEPLVGADWAYGIRHFVSKTTILLGLVYFGTYYIKYNGNDFTLDKSIDTFVSRGRMYPDDPNFPNYRRSPQSYLDLGFYSSPLAVKIDKSALAKSEAPAGTQQTGEDCVPS